MNEDRIYKECKMEGVRRKKEGNNAYSNNESQTHPLTVKVETKTIESEGYSIDKEKQSIDNRRGCAGCLLSASKDLPTLDSRPGLEHGLSIICFILLAVSRLPCGTTLHGSAFPSSFVGGLGWMAMLAGGLVGGAACKYEIDAV